MQNGESIDFDNNFEYQVFSKTQISEVTSLTHHDEKSWNVVLKRLLLKNKRKDKFVMS